MENIPPAHFQWDLVDGVAVVEVLTRDLNQPHLAQELGGQLQALLQAGATKRFVLNFHRTRYMSSTAFAALLGFGKKVDAAGGKATICAMQPDVRIGADILSIGTFIPIHDHEAEALAAVSPAQDGGAGRGP